MSREGTEHKVNDGALDFIRNLKLIENSMQAVKLKKEKIGTNKITGQKKKNHQIEFRWRTELKRERERGAHLAIAIRTVKAMANATCIAFQNIER